MLIELKDISYAYMIGSPVEVLAVSEVSLDVEPGELVALVGPTGSGKSTLVQIMAGLIAPTSGDVFIDGINITENPKEALRQRQAVGLVFQQPEKQLFETTVEEDVAFWPRNAGIQGEEVVDRVRTALEMVGLDFKKYGKRSPFTLSGGEMRKVAIAGILAMTPRVLIMDEPTVGLDPRGKRDLLDKLKALHRAGNAIVMVTHDLDDVAELADRVVLLDRGRVVLDAGPRQVFGGQVSLELDIPTGAHIAKLLYERGFPVEGSPLTIDELAVSILTALRRASA